ncbi:MAG: division plane positioning ATPase MipZ [Alphaproteobacteria bacterium]
MSGPHIIVLGNEKGGSGKSTSAMHIIVALLKAGATVGSLDLDDRQQSLSRYLENRQRLIDTKGLYLPTPVHAVVKHSQADSLAAREAEERAAFQAALARVGGAAQFVVIDCPGRDSNLSRLAHGRADTLITPINDSFVDLDLLARVDGDDYRVLGPSIYAEMVWEARKRRAQADRGSIDWVVMRNRLASLEARNKRRVGDVLDRLAKRIGFRHLAGLSERVIYREMFLNGLTLLDLRDPAAEVNLTLSHVAARAELSNLMANLALPALDTRASAAM